MTALGINLGFFLFQVFNFLIVAILMYAWAYRPILKALDNRKNKIAQSLEDARIAAEARANAEVEATRIITEAKAIAAREVSEASSRAAKAGKDILALAETEAARLREKGAQDGNAKRDEILATVRGQIAALAMAATQKLVGESLNQERQHALINEFFSGVRTGKVVLLEDSMLLGDSAEVTSAIELMPDEKALITREVLSTLGNQQATITFRKDPSILGGLVIKVGDKVLDGSVAGQFESLRLGLK